jgi:hypothetical protein
MLSAHNVPTVGFVLMGPQHLVRKLVTLQNSWRIDYMYGRYLRRLCIYLYDLHILTKAVVCLYLLLIMLKGCGGEERDYSVRTKTM